MKRLAVWLVVTGVAGACSPPSTPPAPPIVAAAPPRSLTAATIDIVSENFFNPFRHDQAVQQNLDPARAARTVELVFGVPLVLSELTTTADLDAFIVVDDSNDPGVLRPISTYLEPGGAGASFSFDRAFFPQNGEGDCDPLLGTDITCDTLLLHFAEDSVPVGTTVIFDIDATSVLGHVVVDGVATPDTAFIGLSGGYGFTVGDDGGVPLALQDYSLRLPQDSGDLVEGLFEEGFCATCPPSLGTRLQIPKQEFYFPSRGVITGIFNEPPARISVYTEAGSPNAPSEIVVTDPLTGLKDGAGFSFTQGVDQQFVVPFDLSDSLATRFYTLAIASDELFVQLGNPGRFLLSAPTQSATGKSFIQTVGATADMPSSDIQSFAVAHVRFPTQLEGGPADHEFLSLGDLPPPGETEEIELPIFVDPEGKMPTVNAIEVSVRDADDFLAARQIIDSDSDCDQLLATCTVTVDPRDLPEGELIFFVTALHTEIGQLPKRLGSDRVRLTVDFTTPVVSSGDTSVSDDDLTDGIIDQVCIASDEPLSAMEITIDPPGTTITVSLAGVTPLEQGGLFIYCVDDIALPEGTGDNGEPYLVTVVGIDELGNSSDDLNVSVCNPGARFSRTTLAALGRQSSLGAWELTRQVVIGQCGNHPSLTRVVALKSFAKLSTELGIGGPGGPLDVLTGALSDRSASVRAAAAVAIVRLDDPLGIAVLDSAKTSETNALVTEILERASGQLTITTGGAP